MRMLLGSIFALIIVGIMISFTVDLHTGTWRQLDQGQLGAIVLLGFGGMFGFMMITGVKFTTPL